MFSSGRMRADGPSSVCLEYVEVRMTGPEKGPGEGDWASLRAL